MVLRSTPVAPASPGPAARPVRQHERGLGRLPRRRSGRWSPEERLSPGRGSGPSGGCQTGRVTNGWRIEERVAPRRRAAPRARGRRSDVIRRSGRWPGADRRRRPSCSVRPAGRRRRPCGALLVRLGPRPPALGWWSGAGGPGRPGVGRRLGAHRRPAGDLRRDRGIRLAGPDVGWALRRIGLTGTDVQGPGPGTCTRWSHQVCFGGMGSGEVTVGRRKVVGLAQRRTRHGAWFHGACLVRLGPGRLLTVLPSAPRERDAAAVELAASVTGVADARHRRQGLRPVPGGPRVGVTPSSAPCRLTRPTRADRTGRLGRADTGRPSHTARPTVHLMRSRSVRPDRVGRPSGPVRLRPPSRPAPRPPAAPHHRLVGVGAGARHRRPPRPPTGSGGAFRRVPGSAPVVRNRPTVAPT